MVMGLLYFIGTALVAYIPFRLYFTWCYFEPMLPELHPNSRAIQFETIICTALFTGHAYFFAAGNEALASVLFWICAGTVITCGVFTPVPEAESDHGFLLRVVDGIFKSTITGFFVSAICSAYIYLIGKPAFAGLSPHTSLFLALMSCTCIVSFLKAGGAIRNINAIDEDFSQPGRRQSLSRLFVFGLSGTLALMFILGGAPSAATRDVDALDDFAMIVCVFLGAALRI